MADAREGWGEIRVAANMSQEALTKKIAPGYFNVMSGAETETRTFTPEERTKFFLAIKQPMDSSIPVCSVEESARRKEFKKRNDKARKTKLPKEPPVKEALKKSTKRKYERKPVIDSPAPSKVKHTVERIAPVIAPLDSISQIKRAALDDIAAIILRPTVTDTQVVNIVNLFKSLAISVVLQ